MSDAYENSLGNFMRTVFPMIFGPIFAEKEYRRKRRINNDLYELCNKVECDYP